jgi:hypothetical protein
MVAPMGDATHTPLKVLLDASIFLHSEFAEAVSKEVRVPWGGKIVQKLQLSGFVRKTPDKDGEYQKQKDALFTVGRLIQENKVAAFDYNEIRFETMRKGHSSWCNALSGCTIKPCSSAIERSKFRQTIDFAEMISKGGKKDRKAGKQLGSASQIAFFSWLNGLSEEQVKVLLSHAALLGLTDFEIQSLRNLGWYQLLCRRSQSQENYPDVFHLWTAERNGCDAILTLDEKLQKLVRQVRSEKKEPIEIKTNVLRPLGLLQIFGINKPDAVPMETNRFYHWHEMPDTYGVSSNPRYPSRP